MSDLYLVLKRHMGLDPGDVVEMPDRELADLHVAGGLMSRVEHIPYADFERHAEYLVIQE